MASVFVIVVVVAEKVHIKYNLFLPIQLKNSIGFRRQRQVTYFKLIKERLIKFNPWN